ncbi:hypothetical protein [Streptomyces sp. NPDC057781]|uniref:hypothetical protein n=1 Tax=unclassified Streptomyces TaxID=2593676 RepID=UPI0036921FA6
MARLVNHGLVLFRRPEGGAEVGWGRGMSVLIAVALAGAVVVAVVIRQAVREARLGLVVRRLLVATVALGLVAWGLMLLPPVNDAVLGDRPRDLADFARMCEGEGDSSGEPFPRAAAYEPGAGPHPWVVIEEEDGWQTYSSTGTETSEPERDKEPDPDAVQLVACSVVTGVVAGTAITCPYNNPLGSDGQTIEFGQGLHTVAVYEARTGDLVGNGRLEGDDAVECWETASSGMESYYTAPERDVYADLLAGMYAAPSAP